MFIKYFIVTKAKWKTVKTFEAAKSSEANYPNRNSPRWGNCPGGRGIVLFPKFSRCRWYGCFVRNVFAEYTICMAGACALYSKTRYLNLNSYRMPVKNRFTRSALNFFWLRSVNYFNGLCPDIMNTIFTNTYNFTHYLISTDLRVLSQEAK